MKQALFWHTFSLVLVALAMSVTMESCLGEGAEQKGVIEPITENDQLPPFRVLLNDETTFQSDSLDGKCCVIVFFTTTCADCRNLLPVIGVFYSEHVRKHDMHLVCIAREQGRAAIESFWRDNQLSLPFAPQEDRRIYNLFATSGVPRIYMADSTGTVRTIFRDTNPPTLQQLIAHCPACQ